MGLLDRTGTALGEGGKALLDTYKQHLKIQSFEKARVLLIDNSGNVLGLHKGLEIYAEINNDEEYARIKGIERVFRVVKRFNDPVTAERLIFITDGNNRSIDINKYYELQNIALKPEEKRSVAEALKINDSKAKTEVFLMQNTFDKKDINGFTLNLNLLDNELKRELSVDALKILFTNAFKLLSDVSNTTLWLVGIICFLAGGLVIGSLQFILLLVLEFIRTSNGGV